jgi:hypothetical protein
MLPAAGQRLIGDIEQRRILQHLVEVAHPVFLEAFGLLGDEAVIRVELATAQFESPPALAR